LLTLTDTRTNNSTKSNPSLIADIYGDWREEVIVRASDNQSLRIYTTTNPSTTRLFTLMHDSQYREAIAWQNVAYNQPAHPSFFVGAGMTSPPQPLIFFGGELSGDYNADSFVDAADYVMWRKLSGTSNLAADGDHDGAVDADDNLVWQKNFGSVSASGNGGDVSVASQFAVTDASDSSSPSETIATERFDSAGTVSKSRRPVAMVKSLPGTTSPSRSSLLLLSTSLLDRENIASHSSLGSHAIDRHENARDQFDSIDSAFEALDSSRHLRAFGRGIFTGS
jgi:hypothetical protein